MSKYVIGVDVGTGSARAGIFDLSGNMIGRAKRDIQLYNEEPDYYEQSGDEIWNAVCESVKESLIRSKVNPGDVLSIGFDATCSLVAVGESGQGLSVGLHGDPNRNIIVWMDHRALAQTDQINSGGHAVLDFVGKKISPEMETPKLLWLKENIPNTYENAAYFFDLTDFLTWKATGSDIRSSCTTACKWTYLAHEMRWDANYFKKIGLQELAERSFRQIGQVILSPGEPIGQGLTEDAAAQLGLTVGTAVPAGLIDAHAGGVGTVGARSQDIDSSAETTMAYVFGTSACTMTTTTNMTLVPGVWGPYFNAMVPDKWLLEAGQSAAGAAIDHLVKLSPAYDRARELAEAEQKGVTQWLSDQVKLKYGDSLSDAAKLAGSIKVVPEFLGNRAPFADPDAKALICGLGMDTSIDGLLSLYVAGILGLGYGLKQILSAQQKAGVKIARIAISGGAGKDPLIRQLIADSTAYPVVTPKSEEPVLLGSAILAATAGGAYAGLEAAMSHMSAFDEVYQPVQGDLALLHTQGFDAFCVLQSTARALT